MRNKSFSSESPSRNKNNSANYFPQKLASKQFPPPASIYSNVRTRSLCYRGGGALSMSRVNAFPLTASWKRAIKRRVSVRGNDASIENMDFLRLYNRAPLLTDYCYGDRSAPGFRPVVSINWEQGILMMISSRLFILSACHPLFFPYSNFRIFAASQKSWVSRKFREYKRHRVFGFMYPGLDVTMDSLGFVNKFDLFRAMVRKHRDKAREK